MSEDALDALRAEIRSAVADNRQPEASATLVALARVWLPRKLRTVTDPVTFCGRVRNWLLPHFGEHTSATLKKRDVDEFLLDLREKRGLSAQTVNHVRDAGRQLIEDAIDNEEWPGANPFAKAKQVKGPRKRKERLSRDEAASLLATLSWRWRPLFALALYLGPRRDTIFNIRKEDVRLTECVIHFNTTKMGDEIRDVPIPYELLPLLRAAMRTSRGPWLFMTRFGSKFSGNNKTLSAALRRALKGARICAADGVSVRQLTFRGLRRCSSTLHQEADCHPWVVSKILGHAQAGLMLPENTTAKFYTQFSPEFIRAELNKLSLL